MVEAAVYVPESLDFDTDCGGVGGYIFWQAMQTEVVLAGYVSVSLDFDLDWSGGRSKLCLCNTWFLYRPLNGVGGYISD